MGLPAALWLVTWFVVCCPGTGVAQTCRDAYRNTVNGAVHTACQPQNRNCTIIRRGLSVADKKALLRRHNKYRSLVAKGWLRGYKPAANMYELVWDDELAEVAQALADRCGDMSHDLASARFTRRFKLTGQNLATEHRSNQVMAANWVRFVDRWFKEHINYPPQQVKRFQPSFNRGPVGHFTQVIWANTQHLGCGFTMFRMKGDFSAMPFKKNYVCNYGNSGNIKGQPVYIEGSPCSRCPAGTRCAKRTGLCRERKQRRRLGWTQRRPRPRPPFRRGGKLYEEQRLQVATVVDKMRKPR